MAEFVTLHEMSPRDGLQNEKRPIATTDKIRLVDLLSGAGLPRIEVTSFVSPKWVLQMADAADVLAGISRQDGIAYTVLTPNLKGYEAARAARADQVAVFASASQSFSLKNINCTIEESLLRFDPLMQAARKDGIPVRGYVSCVTDCPYEGQIAPQAVAGVARSLLELGCFEISLGDTIGHGTPERVTAMLEAVLSVVPAGRLAGHFHDTRGRALDNIEVSLGHGIRVFDASAGGLGGCPYAPGAAGNVASGEVVDLLARLGYVTGIDRDKLAVAETFAKNLRSAR
nr:hydroxymethylglutaryl-CoA lyase [uncultured Gellertiella sp.]